MKTWILKRLLRKSPPNSVSLADPTNDYVSVEIHGSDGSIVVCDSARGDEVVCLADLPNTTESIRPIDQVIGSPLKFRVFKKLAVFRSDSLWSAYYFSCLWGASLFFHRMSRYDHSLKDYRGRMEVLETAVLIREKRRRNAAHISNTLRVSDVMKELYGDMIANSVRQIDVNDNVRMKLCSFVESGEISTDDPQANMRTFVINPAAYTTLSNFGADERRHTDNLRIQRILTFATFLLAIVSLIQLTTTLRLV